jgi:outer membrane protein TolC
LFDHGRATSVEVLDAQTNLLGASLEQVNAQVNLLLARAQLQHAVGRDVPATRE